MGCCISSPFPGRQHRRLTDLLRVPIGREHGLNLYSSPAEPIAALSEPIAAPSLLTYFPSLPNELLLEIAKYLVTARDLLALMLVNKRLAILLDHLLSDMLLREYKGPSGLHSLFAITRRNPDALVLRVIRLEVDLDATFCHCFGSPSYCRCMPALHTAITYSNVTMVDSLLRHGANINAYFGTRGENAVDLAISTAELYSGHFKILRAANMTILQMLLSGGRLQTMNDPASLNRRGHTWLHTAVGCCPREHVTLVQPFLAPGLSLDVADPERKWTALHRAVRNNRVDLVALLLKHGADHRTTDWEGRTPYSSACIRPNWGIMDEMLRHDATLIDEVVNQSGETGEVSFGRHVARLSLDEGESYGYLEEVYSKQRVLAKMLKLAEARRNSCMSDADLQKYYNGL